MAWQSGYKTDNKLIAEAIEFADKSIALDPSSAKGYFAKGLLSFVIKDWTSMYKYLFKAVEMAPNDIEILSNAGLVTVTGGECTLDEFREDIEENPKQELGSCRWKSGWKNLMRAYEMDKGNLYPVKNYGIAHMYNLRGDHEKAYYHMQLAISQGYFWYEIHSAIAAAGLEDDKLAQKHFDAVMKIVNSNKLNDVKAHFARWHVLQYWDLTEPFFSKYGFE